MSDSEEKTSRTVVKTYVPAYQRDEWDARADELDMSRSEFVRTMVQAGWRGFEGVDPPPPEPSETPDREETTATLDLETAVMEALSGDEYHSWEDLLEMVTGNLEGHLEETLQHLRDDGRIRHSPRNGGYTLAGGEP